MRRYLFSFLVGAFSFFIVAGCFVVWFLIKPGDQIIIISILAMPLDIVLFAIPGWRLSLFYQALIFSVFGGLQYGVLGMFVCFVKRKRRRL